MAWVRSTAADLPEVTRYMHRDPGGALFALANLSQHGFEGDDPYTMGFWHNRGAGGALAGVVGLTRNGMVLPVLCDPAQAGDLSALCAALRGRRLIGGAGRPHALRPILDALSLGDHPCDLDEDEDAFHLELDQLRMPATGDLRLRAIRDLDCDLLIRWRTEARIESLNTPPDDAEAVARDEVEKFVAADTHRLLFRGNDPVAMTGFNARLDDVVQIGAVFTPVNLRARGYARAAVALHLQEARVRGVRRALLFTHSAAARRAYVALGFEPNGEFSLVLFSGTQPVQVQ